MNTKNSKPFLFIHLILVIAILVSGVGVITVSALDTFPSASILDNFDRANGAIGGNWSGYVSAFNIASNQLDVTSGGFDTYLFWNNAPFGADQEAYLTFSQVDGDAPEQSLFLKSQSNTSYGTGAIEVLYDANADVVQVWTFHPSNGWAQHGGNIPVVFANGDQFGARASANGNLDVYKNGVLLGTRSITTWSFYSGGGYIGLWFADASDALIDDFGGGSVSTGPTNTPSALPTNTVVFTSTATPLPSTATDIPTLTSTSIFTLTPSNTPLPPTLSLTPTNTNTPLPPTATNTPSGPATIYR
ncbi:MAG TPA: hypothetical protein DCX53_05510, partial [Anaerolineae bacterium]|nr:hypothetical protein [Anaerolineae bacterium]